MKQDLIQQVVSRGIAKQDEAEKEYQRFIIEAEQQFPFLPTEQRVQRAEIMFANYFKALAKSDLQSFDGIILKSTGKDFITKRRVGDEIM